MNITAGRCLLVSAPYAAPGDAEPLRLDDGRLAAPTAPGLGIRLPDNVEERYPYRPGSAYRILGAIDR